MMGVRRARKTWRWANIMLSDEIAQWVVPVDGLCLVVDE